MAVKERTCEGQQDPDNRDPKGEENCERELIHAHPFLHTVTCFKNLYPFLMTDASSLGS
jgi:hypothetical protein